LPGDPDALTWRPGTSRSTSATNHAWLASISSRVITAADAGTEASGSSIADAVTTSRSA